VTNLDSKRILFAAVGSIVLAIPLAANAATVNWIGGATGATTDFSNDANWVGGQRPTAYSPTVNVVTDTANFDGTQAGGIVNKTPTLTADYKLYNATFQDSGWTLDTTSAYTLSVSHKAHAAGGHSLASNATSGTNTINGKLAFGDYNTNSYADVYVAAGGTLRLNAAVSVIADSNNGGTTPGNTSGMVTYDGPGTVELNTTGLNGGGVSVTNGTVKVLAETVGSFTGDGTGGLGTSANGSLTVSGGTFDFNRGRSSLTIIRLTLGSAGTITNSASTAETIQITQNGLNTSLDGLISGKLNLTYLADSGSRTTRITHANTYDGTTTTSTRGILLVNNTTGSGTGSGNISVGANTTLGGTGTISGNVTANGLIAPGDGGTSIGTLTVGASTFGSTGSLNIDLGAGASDKLVVNGNLSLNALTALNLFGTADGVTSYVIARYTGTLTGTFASPTLPAGYSINYGSGSNSQITLAVPEPATLGLIGVGMLGLLARRRRGSGVGAHT